MNTTAMSTHYLPLTGGQRELLGMVLRRVIYTGGDPGGAVRELERKLDRMVNEGRQGEKALRTCTPPRGVSV